MNKDLRSFIAVVGSIMLIFFWAAAIVVFIRITINWMLIRGLIILIPITILWWKVTKPFWVKDYTND